MAENLKSENKKRSHEKTNSSCNSWYGLSAKERVLKVVLESEIELTPLEISKKTHVNHSTTRYYLRKLLNEGKIVQPYPQTYCSKIIHGMIFVPLKFHNIVLTSKVPWLDFSDDVVERVGDVKVRVQFGLQRHKVTGGISCDVGMDKNAVLFALERFFDVVKARSGRDLETVMLVTLETNRDYQGVRIDGQIKCVTRKGLFGCIERIYQKEASVVRCETKISKLMKLDEFESLLYGGISGYHSQQGLFVVTQEVKKMIDAQKFSNEMLQTFGKALNALVVAVTKLVDKEAGE